MVMKKVKSVAFIPCTVLARQECLRYRKRKTKKGGSEYETYERCEIKNGTETLIAHRHSGKDEYLSVKLQDLTTDAILAKEIMDHWSSYRNICRIGKPVANPEEIQEKRVHGECFNDLKNILQMKVVEMVSSSGLEV